MKENSVWCEKHKGESWNLSEAESDIACIWRFWHLFDAISRQNGNREQAMMKLANGDPEMGQLMVNAADEMDNIVNNKANMSGYHLNHISSGKTVFDVFNNNATVYKTDGPYVSEEAARECMPDGATIEKQELCDGFVNYYVVTTDEEESNYLRSFREGAELVGTFDSEEEAETEASAYEDAFIESRSSEDWWVVVNTDKRKLEFEMMFPSQIRALAFLYKVARPKAWLAYIELKEEKEKTEEAV